MTRDPDLLLRIPALASRHDAQRLSDAAFAAGYFLLWQIALHGRGFASRRSKQDPKPDPADWLAVLENLSGACLDRELAQRMERHHFAGVIGNVPLALAAWLRADWPLVLMRRIPAPAEVLEMQASGKRPVTVLAAYPRLLQPVLGKPDGFQFMVHDLEHAHKFFHDARLHRGQRGCFAALRRALERGRLAPYLADGRFKEQFDYLMSDMNTHPVHSLRYLCATLTESLLRREGKTPQDRLSTLAEAELTRVVAGLGEDFGFPDGPRAGLLRMVTGGFGSGDASAIEEALMGAGSGDFRWPHAETLRNSRASKRE